MADATERASGLDLAKQFYDHHRLAFAQAAAAKANTGAAANEVNQFEFSADRFDEWAVGAGHMAMRARDTDGLEHGGVLAERHDIRKRLNRAARKGDGLAVAYTIEARDGVGKDRLWRVVLLERFVTERPMEIVKSIRQCLDRSDNAAAQTNRFLEAQENISNDDRLMVRMRLEMAQMFIINGAQMMEMIIMSFDSEKTPNLRRLRQRMARMFGHVNKARKAPRKTARKSRGKAA